MTTLPVYLLLGDSLTLATALDSAYTTALAHPVYTAGDRGITQRIWDYEDQLVENYDAHTNSHGGGTRIPPAPYTGAGPEFSLIAKLADRHPDDGVIMVKRSSVSATLLAEGAAWVGDPVYSAGKWSKSVASQNWDEFQTDVSACLTAIAGSPPQQGVVQGIFVALGTNDMAVAGGGDVFAGEIGQFVTDLRASYGTSETPVVWVLPQTGTDVSIQAEVTKVREAILQLEASDDLLAVVNIDDLPKHTDQIHLAPSSTITMGERMDEALGGLVASFVVEDGSGKADSNSYVSVEAADVYFERQGNPSTWSSSTRAQKQMALRVATSYISERYGNRWRGVIDSDTQALDWPRSGVVDADTGLYYDNDEMPARLLNATAEVALRYRAGTTLRPDVAIGDGNVTSSTVSVGGISITEDFVGSATTAPDFPEVKDKLRSMLTDGGAGMLHRVTR